MNGGQWITAGARPEPLAGVRVERHPALASSDPAGRYPPLEKPLEVHALGQSFRLDRVPYLLAVSGEKPVGAVSLALFGDDLLLLGFESQPELGQPGVSTALVQAAVEVAREIGRRRLLVPLTNADPLALFFLQVEGFAVAEVNPYVGPERVGLADIVATHELLLERLIV